MSFAQRASSLPGFPEPLSILRSRNEDGREMEGLSGSGGTFHLTWTADGHRHWFRPQVSGPDGKLWLLGNPVYVDWGKPDAVAFGKLFIANPDLPLRFAGNATLNAPVPETFYSHGEQGYVDYPALGA